ncbi:MAG: DEAD/DEAH box helicase family protein [Alphaproteobacteria bacterium]|nr:DEAD/DEAH box helicase family protein [Alphaproteobacteria bacterium]
MNDRVKAFRRVQKKYKNDPVAFGRELLHFDADENQARVMMDVADYNRITVRSGQGVGKTALMSIIILWFLTCYPYARVVCTAPTRQQLHDVLWSEIEKWRAKSPLLSAILKWTKTYVYMSGYEKRWFAVARTATKPENMQGFHEDNMLFVIDEASGVSEPIMEAVLGTLSGPNNKLLMCGNPTQTRGTFYDSHTRDKSVYQSHHISSRDCPRTNKENIAAMERKYGKHSNFIRVRVDGEFPLQEDDVFIPLSLLEASVQTQFALKRPIRIDIGCDVARFGDDKTVIAYKINENVTIHLKINGQDLMKTADKIIELGVDLIRQYKYTGTIMVRIDDGGVGGGVTDRLRQIKKANQKRFAWMEVLPVQFGRRIKHAYYYDSTTFMLGVIKSMLSTVDEEGNPKAVDLILPNDADLIAQLSTRKYEMTENSKLRVESKDEVKKRIGVSPDEADCVMLLCVPAMARGRNGGESADERGNG